MIYNIMLNQNIKYVIAIVMSLATCSMSMESSHVRPEINQRTIADIIAQLSNIKQDFLRKAPTAQQISLDELEKIYDILGDLNLDDLNLSAAHNINQGQLQAIYLTLRTMQTIAQKVNDEFIPGDINLCYTERIEFAQMYEFIYDTLLRMSQD